MNSIVVDANVQLLPCPFCGGTDTQIEGESPGEMFEVQCMTDGCEASGPPGKDTIELAAEAWDRRAVGIDRMADNSVKLKVRRPRIRRFLWHVKDGYFRSEGYSWRKIWEMTKDASHG